MSSTAPGGRNPGVRRPRPAVPALVLSLVGVGAACGALDTEEVQPPEAFPPLPPTGLQLYRPTPEVNPLTPKKVALGRRLFFDSVVSRDYSMSCASCHRPELAFSDSLPVSPGVDGRRGPRATPPLVNRVYGRAFFWDGRAGSLEEAAVQAIGDPLELDLGLERLVARLQGDEGYREAFALAFPDRPLDATAVSRALASYLRTIMAGDAPGDRYAAEGSDALDEDARAGRGLFMGRARCAFCHAGPNLTDEEFHNTGGTARSGDPGRYAVTGREEDRGRFRTPTLREVERTTPYMHDGALATLEEVVEFYDRGGEPHPNLSRDIRPLNLTDEEKEALVAFLRSLSGTVREGIR